MSAYSQNYVYETTKDMIKKLDETAISKEQLKKCQEVAKKYPMYLNGKRTQENR